MFFETSSYTHAERIKSNPHSPDAQCGHIGCGPRSKSAGKGYPHLKHFGLEIQLKLDQHFAHNEPCDSTTSLHIGQIGG